MLLIFHFKIYKQRADQPDLKHISLKENVHFAIILIYFSILSLNFQDQ